eukprot:scaffold306443_cov26-Tisochrysis_lutea.AAC.1
MPPIMQQIAASRFTCTFIHDEWIFSSENVPVAIQSHAYNGYKLLSGRVRLVHAPVITRQGSENYEFRNRGVQNSSEPKISGDSYFSALLVLFAQSEFIFTHHPLYRNLASILKREAAEPTASHHRRTGALLHVFSAVMQSRVHLQARTRRLAIDPRSAREGRQPPATTPRLPAVMKRAQPVQHSPWWQGPDHPLRVGGRSHDEAAGVSS